MVKGMFTPKMTPPHNFIYFFILLLLIDDRMEGCAPCLVLGTKKGEGLMEGELVGFLSLLLVPYMLVALEDLATPLVTISSLVLMHPSYHFHK